jgi:hypothetical protein
MGGSRLVSEHLRAERARRTPLRAIRAWRSVRSNESRRGVLVDGWCPRGQRGRGLVGSGRHDRSQRAEGLPRRALRLRPKRDADRARRRMESVSPKIPAEVGVLLKHRCPHAGAREEVTEHVPAGPPPAMHVVTEVDSMTRRSVSRLEILESLSSHRLLTPQGQLTRLTPVSTPRHRSVACLYDG